MTIAEKWGLVLSAIQTVAVIAGFYFAYKQLSLLQRDLHNSVELSARQNAMDLMARYSDPEFSKFRGMLRSSKDLQSSYYDCCSVLNFLEEIAISCKHRTANRQILEDAFATSLRSWLRQDYMIKTMERARATDKARYENLLELYDSWGGEHAVSQRIRSIPDLVPSR